MKNQFWAGLWKKGLGWLIISDYEHLLSPVFFKFPWVKNQFIFFCPWKIEKTTQKSCSESAQTPFSHGPAQATAHSPKLISHIKKFRNQTSVLSSVGILLPRFLMVSFLWSGVNVLPGINLQFIIEEKLHEMISLALCLFRHQSHILSTTILVPYQF